MLIAFDVRCKTEAVPSMPAQNVQHALSAFSASRPHKIRNAENSIAPSLIVSKKVQNKVKPTGRLGLASWSSLGSVVSYPLKHIAQARLSRASCCQKRRVASGGVTAYHRRTCRKGLSPAIDAGTPIHCPEPWVNDNLLPDCVSLECSREDRQSVASSLCAIQ